MAKLGLEIHFTAHKTIWYYVLLFSSRTRILLPFLGIKTILKMKYQNKVKELIRVDFKSMEVSNAD